MSVAAKFRPPAVRPSSKRAKLHAADPRCFWCGIDTVLDYPQNGIKPRHDSATLDHLYSRLHPNRRQPRGSDRREVLHVLACQRCNHERSVREQQGKVFVPRLRHRQQIALETSATTAAVVLPKATRDADKVFKLRTNAPSSLRVVLPPIVGLKCPVCDRVRPVGVGCCASGK